MNKETIIRNFSRYARSYDKYADIQKRAGSELLGLMNGNRFRKILEIGCGTGNYTLILREKFGSAEIKAVDISEKMIEVASEKLKGRDIEFMAADAETFEIDGDFDCITSNASLQWFGDLDGTMRKFRGLLKRDGMLFFSIFGPSTFRELNASLGYISKGLPVSAADFAGKKEIEAALNRNFGNAKITESVYEETFPCLHDLLRKIKYTGIRGEASNGKAAFTPRLLRELEEAYLNKFRRIRATYQIFYCKGRR